jgi:hypothetical protein
LRAAHIKQKECQEKTMNLQTENRLLSQPKVYNNFFTGEKSIIKED